MRQPVIPRGRSAWLLAVTVVSFLIALGALWVFGVSLRGGSARGGRRSRSSLTRVRLNFTCALG